MGRLLKTILFLILLQTPWTYSSDIIVPTASHYVENIFSWVEGRLQANDIEEAVSVLITLAVSPSYDPSFISEAIREDVLAILNSALQGANRRVKPDLRLDWKSILFRKSETEYVHYQKHALARLQELRAFEKARGCIEHDAGMMIREIRERELNPRERLQRYGSAVWRLLSFHPDGKEIVEQNLGAAFEEGDVETASQYFEYLNSFFEPTTESERGRRERIGHILERYRRRASSLGDLKIMDLELGGERSTYLYLVIAGEHGATYLHGQSIDLGASVERTEKGITWMTPQSSAFVNSEGILEFIETGETREAPFENLIVKFQDQLLPPGDMEALFRLYTSNHSGLVRLAYPVVTHLPDELLCRYSSVDRSSLVREMSSEILLRRYLDSVRTKHQAYYYP